jgi:hypothetical protein
VLWAARRHDNHVHQLLAQREGNGGICEAHASGIAQNLESAGGRHGLGCGGAVAVLRPRLRVQSPTGAVQQGVDMEGLDHVEAAMLHRSAVGARVPGRRAEVSDEPLCLERELPVHHATPAEDQPEVLFGRVVDVHNLQPLAAEELETPLH